MVEEVGSHDAARWADVHQRADDKGECRWEENDQLVILE